MPKNVPAYRQRKGYDQAIVTLRDAVTKKPRDYWLGTYDTPQSRELYHRVIAAWEANGRRLIDPPAVEPSVPLGITIIEVSDQFQRWADGELAKQDRANVKLMLRILNQLYGTSEAATFGPNKLRQVREQMIHGDPMVASPRKPWSRNFVNAQVRRLIRMFKWAASHELLSATIYQQLRSVEPLRKGKCAARETDPVKPVADELVEAVRPNVSSQVRAMIDLQRLSGARPCELIRLRPKDIHRDDAEVWTYSPTEHKTAYRGRPRTIYFGPRARQVLEPFISGRPDDACLFQPIEAEARRRALAHEKRKTKLVWGNAPGTNRKARPRKQPGEHYTTDSYAKAILKACDKTFPLPTKLERGRLPIDPTDPKAGTRRELVVEWRKRIGEDLWKQVRAWYKAHRWHPYQLRHSAATYIRREFGLEAAQIALGHSSALVTEAVYAERDQAKVMQIMKRIG